MTGPTDPQGVCQNCHQLRRRHTTEQLCRCARERSQQLLRMSRAGGGRGEPAELVEYLHALLQDLVNEPTFEGRYLGPLGLSFKRATDPALHEIAATLAVQLIDFTPSRPRLVDVEGPKP